MIRLRAAGLRAVFVLLAGGCAGDRHAVAAAAVQRDGKIVVAAGIQGRVARMYRLLRTDGPIRGSERAASWR
jgi:hypothetical protein